MQSRDGVIWEHLIAVHMMPLIIIETVVNDTTVLYEGLQHLSQL